MSDAKTASTTAAFKHRRQVYGNGFVNEWWEVEEPPGQLWIVIETRTGFIAFQELNTYAQVRTWKSGDCRTDAMHLLRMLRLWSRKFGG